MSKAVKSSAMVLSMAFLLTACGEANTRKVRGNGDDATFTVHPQAGICQMVSGVSEKRGMFGFFQSRGDLQVNVVPCTQAVLDQLPKGEREAYLAAGHKAVPYEYAP